MNLNDTQKDSAAAYLAEVIMESVYQRAKKQARVMVDSFSEVEEQLEADTVMSITYQIMVPVVTIRKAIEQADG